MLKQLLNIILLMFCTANHATNNIADYFIDHIPLRDGEHNVSIPEFLSVTRTKQGINLETSDGKTFVFKEKAGTPISQKIRDEISQYITTTSRMISLPCFSRASSYEALHYLKATPSDLDTWKVIDTHITAEYNASEISISSFHENPTTTINFNIEEDTYVIRTLIDDIDYSLSVIIDGAEITFTFMKTKEPWEFIKALYHQHPSTAPHSLYKPQ